MYDILPPSGNSDSLGSRRKQKAVPPTSDVGAIQPGPRVVQIQWKLPARLRKPIRVQLQQQRQEKRRRQAAAVTFARRELNTPPLLVADEDVKKIGARVQKPKRFFNRGAEKHTGDVYAQSRPSLHVAAPPYVGSAGKAPVQKAVPRRVPAQAKAPVRVAPVPKVKKRPPMMFAERDVAMKWDEPVTPVTNEELFVQIEKPKRVLPALTFNLWPGKWFGRQKADVTQNTSLRSAAVKTMADEQGLGGLVASATKKKRLI